LQFFVPCLGSKRHSFSPPKVICRSFGFVFFPNLGGQTSCWSNASVRSFRPALLLSFLSHFPHSKTPPIPQGASAFDFFSPHLMVQPGFHISSGPPHRLSSVDLCFFFPPLMYTGPAQWEPPRPSNGCLVTFYGCLFFATSHLGPLRPILYSSFDGSHSVF